MIPNYFQSGELFDKVSFNQNAFLIWKVIQLRAGVLLLSLIIVKKEAFLLSYISACAE
jgi:hypothetical protein